MSPSFIVRPASLADASAMGRIASETYQNATLNAFLSPYQALYPADHRAGYQQRIAMRMLDPRNISYVACDAASPGVPIGYAQFVRLGDDAGARGQIASKKTLLLVVLAWVYTIWFKIRNFVIPDRSQDRKALEMFHLYTGDEERKHWAAEKFPERRNRWHGQSVVVGEKWQRKGVGAALMNEALKRARAEGVVVGLESSGDGEWLYRKMGFQLLGRFMNDVGGKDEGGVMMWTPETAMKKE